MVRLQTKTAGSASRPTPHVLSNKDDLTAQYPLRRETDPPARVGVYSDGESGPEALSTKSRICSITRSGCWCWMKW